MGGSERTTKRVILSPPTMPACPAPAYRQAGSVGTEAVRQGGKGGLSKDLLYNFIRTF
jgi:hypothetical protein